MRTTLAIDINILTGGQDIHEPPVSTASPSDIASFGKAAGLSRYHILVLLLKQCAESGPDQTGAGKWPINRLHDALGTGAQIEWPHEQLQVCIIEMTLMGLHEISIDADELDFYEQQKRKSRSLQRGASEDIKCCYDRLHDQWLHLQLNLEDALLYREDALVRRECDRQGFMREFGLEFLAERQQLMRVEILELKSKLLKESPDLSMEQLEKLTEDTVRRLRDELDRDQRTLGFALQPHNSIDLCGSPAEMAKLKVMLKKVWMILHPDRLLSVPLTDNQRRELRCIWDLCQSIKASDMIAASDGMLFRSVAELERLYKRAQDILAQAGIDIDTGLIVKGETLSERITWLKLAITGLQRDLHLLHLELREWRDDPEIRCMIALSNMPAAEQEQEKECMRSRTEALREKAAELEQGITQQMGGVQRA